MIYQTRQDDVLDDIVFRYYGDTENGIVELILERNSGLADYGPNLPAGIMIDLVDRPPVSSVPLTRLWS